MLFTPRRPGSRRVRVQHARPLTAWAQDWRTPTAFSPPKQVPRTSQGLGGVGRKQLQSLIAKGVYTGKPFTGALRAVSSKHRLCPSSLYLLVYFLFLKNFLSLVLYFF